MDLNQQVEDPLAPRASLNGKAVLHWEPAFNLPPMEGDIAQVRQVIANLVINAVEALEREEGIITLRTGTETVSQETLDGPYQGQALQPGLHLTLEVSDNGPGMASDVVERIYDPFYTTKAEGRGLGLSVVRGVLQEPPGRHPGHAPSRAGARPFGSCSRPRRAPRSRRPRRARTDVVGVQGHGHRPRGGRRGRGPGRGRAGPEQARPGDPGGPGRPGGPPGVRISLGPHPPRPDGSHHAAHGRRGSLPGTAAGRRPGPHRPHERVRPGGGAPAVQRHGPGGLPPEAVPPEGPRQDHPGGAGRGVRHAVPAGDPPRELVAWLPEFELGMPSWTPSTRGS